MRCADPALLPLLSSLPPELARVGWEDWVTRLLSVLSVLLETVECHYQCVVDKLASETEAGPGPGQDWAGLGQAR